MNADIGYIRGNNIYISVDDEQIASVGECRIYSKRKGEPVSGYGDSESFGIALGSAGHYISLKRISMEHAVNFRNLGNFELVITKPYETLTFSGCEWTELSENITPSDNVIETASICARDLNITEVPT